MAFFGLTNYGVSSPIKFQLRDDYKEPETPPTLLSILYNEKRTQPFAEAIRELDIYSGILDGYAYKSAHRITKFRKRGFLKKDGPADVYQVPICETMNYGWWLTDPELKDQTWYKPDCFIPIPMSSRTKFVNKALLLDKQFIL